MEIDDIIDFEGEHTGLDFKAIQYKKEIFYELLKDVIAMANATVEGDRLLIAGVKKHADGSSTINPILQEEFTDAANYQKLINDNIEPDLHIDYFPHRYKGNQLIGVLKIGNCEDKPYMMKKDFNGNSDKTSRKKGESFIRKGTTTLPLMRKDIDRIFEQRKQADAFSHKVSFYFSNTLGEKMLALSPAVIEKLPSQKQAERIRAIIIKKEQKEKEHREKAAQDKFYAAIFSHQLSFTGLSQSGPYENRSLEVLREDLEKIGETYYDNDRYEVFEKKAEKINITVLNDGTKYLEDAVIEVEIPDKNGILIADKIYRKPVDSPSYLPLRHIYADAKNLDYPQFKKKGDKYIWSEKLGDLRHLQPKEIFLMPLRVTIGSALAGSEVKIKLTLFGKNLPTPIKDILLLKIN